MKAEVKLELKEKVEKFEKELKIAE